MAKSNVNRMGQAATRSKATQPKDQPETVCIVCGSNAWCECEWDHFYGESVVVQEKEAGVV